ncbi:MAG TPA: ABC transporter ATP-binding protein [Jiangellales bacterium]|nr:ABC transporter ATP-binding protein [Jiangellales bacterium]
MTSTVLSTTGLVRRYESAGRSTGVLGVDLAVPRGVVYGLVGPNGAGKTTLLSLVTGLRTPDAGTVELAVDRRRVAVVTDVPEFEPWLTAAEVVRLAAHLVGADDSAAAVDRALAEVGLGESAGRRVGGFSRGMSQRLALAAAFAGEPELLVLDEPSSALDPAGRAAVLDLVLAWGRRATVVLSSHVLSDVQRVADVVGVLDQGTLRYQGPLAELLAQHVRPRWTLHVRDGAAALAEALRAEPWVEHVEVDPGDGMVRVRGTDLDRGETGLVRVAAAVGARVVSLAPEEADLESAFLALTGGPR